MSQAHEKGNCREQNQSVGFSEQEGKCRGGVFPIRVMLKDEEEACREDYARFLEETGYSLREAQERTLRQDDIHPVDLAPMGVRLSVSPLGGLGVFAVASIPGGQIIGPARLEDRRTQLGRYLNHSPRPNVTFTLSPSGAVMVKAIRPIMREELLVDYRSALALPGVRQPKSKEPLPKPPTPAGDFETNPNELLEEGHAERMDG